MPAKKVPGIGRINIRCQPWFADLVAVTAKKTDRTLSSYVRTALQEQMKRDGVNVDAPTEMETGKLSAGQDDSKK